MDNSNQSSGMPENEKPNWVTTVYIKPSKGKSFAQFLALLTIISIAAVSFITVPVFIFSNTLGSASMLWSNMAADVDPNAPLPEPSVMLDSNGVEFARLYVQNRIPLTYEEIPLDAVHALVAAEDKNFWTNNGISWDGIIRALYYNISEGEVLYGGSGLTQQYVKNLLIIEAKTSKEIKAASEQSLNRKLVEAATAVKLESILDKKEILTKYFNTVYFGNNAYGIGAASSYYFGKKAADLTLGEISLLVASIQSPDQVNPINDMRNVVKRQSYVLDRMVSDGYISSAVRSEALGEKIVLKITKPSNGCPASKYAFYCEWVKNEILNNTLYGDTVEEREKVLYQGGLVIKTSLNPAVQDAADIANRNGVSGSSNFVSASASIEPGTGHVLALSTNKVFGQDKNETEIVYPVIKEFKPGGVFKIATAASALEEGWHVDTSFEAGNEIGGNRNIEPVTVGSYNMFTALNSNVDTWFLKLQEKIGVVKIANSAYKMGLKTLPLNKITASTNDLSLGKDSASVLEVANMYATVAAHGVACNPVGIVSITNSAENILPVPMSECKQVLRASTADTLTSLLVGNMVSGNGVRAQISESRPSAGLSGTSVDGKSVWFAGFIPQMASAVWIGDPTGSYSSSVLSIDAFGQSWSPAYGSGPAAVLWQQLMSSGSSGMPFVGFTPGGGESSVGVTAITPDVRGLTSLKAVSILENSGYKVTVIPSDKKDDRYASNVVVSQTPTSGSIADAGNMQATIVVNK